MKNRGFIVTTTAMIIVLLSFAIISIIYVPSLSQVRSVKNIEKSIEPFIENRTIYERIYGILYENISYEDDIFFPDLNKKYLLEDIESIDRESIEVRSYDNYSTESFVIENETDIEITIDNIEPTSYIVEDENGIESIYYDQGTVYFSLVNEETGQVDDTIVFDVDQPVYNLYDKISKEKFYIRKNNILNYGKFYIEIASRNIENMSYGIIYYENRERNIKLTDVDTKKELFLRLTNTISEDGKKEVYYIDGSDNR